MWPESVHWVYCFRELLGGTKLGTDYVLPRTTWHKQSNLKMAPICVGLEGAQERPSCKESPVVPSARPGSTSDEVQGSLKLDAACLRQFRKI